MTSAMFRLISEADFRGGRLLPGRTVTLTLCDRMVVEVTAEVLCAARYGGWQPEDEWDG